MDTDIWKEVWINHFAYQTQLAMFQPMHCPLHRKLIQYGAVDYKLHIIWDVAMKSNIIILLSILRSWSDGFRDCLT